MHHVDLGSEAIDPQSAAASASSAYVDSIESASVHSHGHGSVQDRHGDLEVLAPRPSVFDNQMSNVSNRSKISFLSRQATSIKTTATMDPRFEVDWDDDNDQLNPRNWPLWYRGLIIGAVSYSTWSV